MECQKIKITPINLKVTYFAFDEFSNHHYLIRWNLGIKTENVSQTLGL